LKQQDCIDILGMGVTQQEKKFLKECMSIKYKQGNNISAGNLC